MILLQRMSPLLAQSGHHVPEFQCLLLLVKRTSVAPSTMSAFDPKRTLASPKSRNGCYGISDHGCLGHSALMLAARITLPHFSVSSAINFPKSVGVIGIGKSCLDLGIGEGGIDFAVELIDDFSRRFLGCADTVPGGRLISRHKLSEGRNVWQRFRAHHGSYRERTQIAGPDVPD